MAEPGTLMTRGRRRLLLGVLGRSLGGQPRDTAWLAVWSSVQALPALASGWLVARATGDFLAGGPGTGRGLQWLGLLGLAAVVGALASRQTYLRVAALVEPLRDELVRLIVAGALRHATDDSSPPDTGAVARITHQAEIVRDSFAGLLAVGVSFTFTAASSLAGLAALVPAVLPFAAVPMVVSLALFCCLLPSLAARQRRSVVGEEAVADSAAAALAGLRDAVACGAEDRVRDEIDDRVTAQAAALRAVASMNMLRTLCLAVGGWLPLVLVLAAAPSLVRRGVSPGAIIGALTYIGGALQSALYSLTQGLGGSGVRLSITLQRILEASGAAPTPASGTARTDNGAVGPDGGAASPQRHVTAWLPRDAAPSRVFLRGVSFAYGPHAEPVLRGLDLDIPEGDHLAVVGPSGIGKSTLAELIAGLLHPQAGEVWLDGVLLSRIPPADLPRYRTLIPRRPMSSPARWARTSVIWRQARQRTNSTSLSTRSASAPW